MATLSARLFPTLDASGRDSAVLKRIIASPSLAPVLRARRDRRAACGLDLICRAQALLWSDMEAQALRAAAAREASLPASDDGVDAQIGREVAGINMILRTYALGQPATTPIDGAGTVSPRDQQSRLQAADWIADTPRTGSSQQLDPSLDYALAMLDVSGRTDAIGFEPLMASANAAVSARAKGLDWNRYRYTALIVTGVGPEIEGEPLSPFGKYHLRLAARRFAQGDIAFIILSGGRAHPRATPFTEAVEMKKALIERYGVPADTIVIEPYARHTTTNLRNASRLLMQMGGPLDKDALIICNPVQSAYIESAKFIDRNAAELGYQPGRVASRISPTELVFRPFRASARVDPRDPLDP
ncbi:YdcF family protein [Sphingobium sp.]|uniref:YdcF family protein n=1 Tax=Sphingobium sp. TaxID=1912891 RepID=UPI002E1D9BA9